MSNIYPGKTFVPPLPLERCRPLEERLSVRLSADPRVLAKAARAAAAAEVVARDIEAARKTALGRAKRQRRQQALEAARAAGRSGPTKPNPWRDEP